MGGGAAEGGQYSMAKTSVWWDIENCQVPKGFDAHVIAQNISSALADLDYRGPVSIHAYGDTHNIPSFVQQALSSTGIALNHVPAGVKDASDKKILVDMLFWAVDNPPPANYLLISGDRDFSNALHQLGMRRYNILLAQPQNVSAPLLAAAKSVWLWTSLLLGGATLQSADASLPANSETSKNVSSDPLQEKLSVEPVPETFHLGNRKPYGNSKFDNKFKGKHLPRRTSSQSSISKTSSNEFWQSPTETQGRPSNGSSDESNQMWMGAIPQQNQGHTSKLSSIESQGSSQPSFSGAGSSFFHPTPLNVSREHNFPVPPASSFPQQPQYAQGRQFNEAPRELFADNKHKTSSAPPSFGARGHDPSWNNGNNFSNNYPFQHPQPLRPTDLQPAPTSAPGNLFSPNSHFHSPQPLPPRSDGPSFTSGPPTIMPDIAKLNISDYSNSLHYNPTSQQQTEPRPNVAFESSNPGKFYASHNGHHPHHHPSFNPDTLNSRYPHHGPEFRPPASRPMDNAASNEGPWGTPGYSQPYVQGYIGVVLLALDTLKNDKMVPTEANIADCIRYGDMKRLNFSLRAVLDSAIEQQRIVTRRVGALQIYLPKNVDLWKCVNHIGTNVKHPKAIWDTIEKFLSSVDGRSAIMSSECRYHAAIILKKSCLTHLVLGDILQILHVIVTFKKWITTHSSDWQPISITLAEANGEAGAKYIT
ncbi:hypothetical protein AAC387_Pa09g0112 [Persea americana]